MLFPMLVVFPLAASLLLYVHLRKRGSNAAVWRYAFKIAIVVGLLRSGLVCAGWWFAERTSGFLQTPGYFFTVFAWPEALLLPRSPKLLTFAGYITLGTLVFFGAVVWVLAVATVVVVMRPREEL